MKIRLSNDEKNKLQTSKVSQSDTKEENISDVPIEDKTQRTLNSRVYVLPNGQFRKVIYGQDVHYYNEEEKCFRSIDNRLTQVIADESYGASCYANRYHSCKVRVAGDTSGKRLISIKRGEHSLYWGLIETAANGNTEGNVVNKKDLTKARKANRHSTVQIKDKKSSFKAEYVPENLEGEVVYPSAFEGADLQYIIQPQNIKENIIIRELSDSYEFAFRIQTENLTVKLSDDCQKIEFCSIISDSKKIFTIPAPFMKDASGRISTDVYYDIEDDGENKYIFKIIASTEWINERSRVLPVIIDPMIETVKDYYGSIECACLNARGNIQYNVIGKNSLGANRICIKQFIPDFGKDIILNSAQLNVSYTEKSSGLTAISAHRLTTSRSFSELTFSNASYDSAALDLAQLTDNTLSVDLTEYFENILYKGKYVNGKNWDNLGILLKMEDENRYTNDSYIKLSGNYNVVLDYRIDSGVRRGQMFSTHEAGRSGTAQVNLRTGAAKFVHESIAVPGNRFPVNISLVYDSYLANRGLNLNSIPDLNYPEVLKEGWKINYQQFLIPETYVYGRGGYIQRYRYIDGEGVSHYFEKDSNNANDILCKDEDGLGLSIKMHISSWSTDGTIYDLQGNSMIFKNMRLEKIIKRNGDEISIEFRENSDTSSLLYYQISQITFANGKKATFNYNSLNRLTSVNYDNTETVSYGYTYYGQLELINYADGKTTSFSYNANRTLKSVTDVSGKQLTFGYRTGQPFMVEKVTEGAIYTEITDSSKKFGSMQGETLTIEYLSKNLVRTTDRKNIVKYYSFDSEGNVVSSWENNGTSALAPIRTAEYNGRDIERGVSCAVSYSLPALVKADSSFTLNSGERLISRVTDIKADKMYILSGFAVGNSATISEDDIVGEGRTFELKAKVYNNLTSEPDIYRAKFDTRNISQQMAVTAFRTDKNVTRIEIYASYSNNINSATFNNIRLVQGNATVSERKILSSDGDVFDVNEITAVEYKLKEDSVDGNSDSTVYYTSKKVTAADFNRMYADANTSDVITLRTNNSRNLIKGVYDVKIKFNNILERTFALKDLEIKYITTTETGETERVNEKVKTLDNPLYIYRPEDGKAITFSLKDIKSINYHIPTMPSKDDYVECSDGVIFTEEDIKKTIYCVHTGQRYVYYTKDGKAMYRSISSTYYVNFVTNKGSYNLRFVDVLSRRTVTKTIKSNGNEFTEITEYDEYGQKQSEQNIKGIVTEYQYDNYGNVTRQTTYNKANTSKQITSRYSYDNGNRLIKEYDERGEYTETAYNADGSPKETYTQSRHKTQYSYIDKLLSKMHTSITDGSTTSENANNYAYNSDYLTQVSHNGVNYDFTYNGLGDITEISVAGQKSLTMSQLRTSGKSDETETVTESGTTNSRITVKDYIGNIKSVQYNDDEILQNTYEYDGERIKTSIDKRFGISYNYTYNEDNSLKKIEYSGSRTGTITVEYDTKNRIAKQNYTFESGARTLAYSYGYEKDSSGKEYPGGETATVALSSCFTQNASKDGLDRLSKLKLQTSGSYAEEQSYTYAQGSSSAYTTGYISAISYGTTSESYSYDKNGNVKTVTTAGGTVTYTYDGLNRLTQEINGVTGKKYNYTYDAGGNILTKKITNISTGYTEQQLNYVYDSVNKDRLVRVGYDTIGGYDSQGRPTTYRGMSLSWNDGSVGAFVTNGNTVSAKYNAEGIRVEKSGDGKTHKYYLEEKTIVREQVTGTSNYDLYYMHGLDGIVGFTYVSGGTAKNYYYRKNLFGDITAIFDDSGTVYAKYAYDAWGNCSILQDTNGIGTLNPFRYRSYYWDGELNLYYLNARYYDPEIGRFVSQDDLSYLDPETLNGLNLYAYCLNNPVMGYDPDGTWDWDKFWRGVGRVVTGALAVVAGAMVIASGVAGVAMLVVAGVTIAAGVLTAVNGVADAVEAGTDYNFVRDGVFQGNETAYNIYANITEGVAIVGSMICGGWLKANAPRIKAYKNVGKYDYTNTVKNYFPNGDVVMKGNKYRPYIQSSWAQKTIIKHGKMIKDTFGYMFVYKNAEIGVNLSKNLIWHMLIK